MQLSLWVLAISAGIADGSANNLLNLSARNFVPSGGGRFIGGFITQGSQPISVVLRGIGPSLATHGVANAMQDPVIELHDGNGTLLQKNDDWVMSPDAQKIAALGLAPTSNVESAILATLSPGAYTLVMYPYNNGTANPGVGVLEMYDLQSSPSRFGNISALGAVSNSNRTLIAGLIIGGDQKKQIVIRAIRNPNDTTFDPRLEVYDGSGSLIASNDDWQQDPRASDVQRVGLAPRSPKESALFLSLDAGNYTAVVQTAESVAIDLVEVYDITTAP